MESEKKRVVLSVEVNEKIYSCMQHFLNSNPQWNRKMLIDASMSLFLMQNHKEIKPTDYQACSKNYVDSVCAISVKYSQN